ncbi:hypothetical protein FVEN_g12782 [Fusarium venenatum]|nr:hypothetical protein FVEN_g12782 [Fusarium venenatum]
MALGLEASTGPSPRQRRSSTPTLSTGCASLSQTTLIVTVRVGAPLDDKALIS